MALEKKRRSLRVDFYTDPYVEGLNRDEQDVFLTLLLNPQNNIAGIYEISINKLAYYSKMDYGAVQEALSKLQNDKKILYIDNWVAIKNHIKNQAINSNMAKSIVDLLKEVPMVHKVFVLLDGYGNLEKWTQRLIEQLEDYYNVRKRRRMGSDNFDAKQDGVHISQEEFINEINGIDSSINSNNKAFEKEEIGNRKKEIGNRKEEEGNTKKEIGRLAYDSDEEDQFSEVDDTTPTRYQHSEETIYRILRYSKIMNSLPEERRLTVNIPNLGEIKDQLSYYTTKEIKQALDNYEQIVMSGEYDFKQYSSIVNFILNGGLQKFQTDADPWNKYPKKKSGPGAVEETAELEEEF